MQDPVEPSRRAPLTDAWIVVISAWVAAGAIFKLIWGTPALLPEVVRGVPLELGVTYNLAIGIELALAAVALTRPRIGWLLLAALLAVFDVVLTTQIAAGTENCGCFGNKLSMPPWVMMVIDSVLLAGLLVLRPWRTAPRGLPLLVPAALAAVALVVPWLLDRELEQGQIVANGKPVEGRWANLEVAKWVGKDIWDTPLGQPPLSEYIDVASLPLDGLWVFWRQTCDHCAQHLAALAESEHGERLITLVQLEEPHDTLANRVVHALPDGNFVQHARLPPSIAYVIQTPAELALEGGRIVAAEEGVAVE
jgi:hypothetical protein